MPLQPRGRDQRQPGRPDGDPAGDHDAVHGPFGHGADDLPERQPGADGPRHAGLRSRSRGPDGDEPLHRGERKHHRRPGRPDRDEDAAHGHGGSAADTDADDARVSGLLPVRGSAELHLAVHQRANDDTTWADHTDVRPTMLSLLGLEDSYVHDGRVLTNALDNGAAPHALREHRRSIKQLGDTYKQLNAPFGQFAMNMLAASTKAIKSGTAADDSRYTSIEDQIASLTSARDALATQIRNALDAAAFGGPAINVHQARDWIAQAQVLLNRSAALAAMT